ncbi:MAG TPA: hypothetical protein DDW99_02885 [Ruminococcaceae bacterium]|jgi:hypothetical protein|nr:hypothetical protein [Oscillospiraceae bacterium]
MDIKGLSSKIRRQKKTFLKLEELRELLCPDDYDSFYSTMAALQEAGALRPVGSAHDTNGMLPPLRLKYRVLREKEDDTAEIREIRLLAPGLNISGYLEHPALYRKHRDILLPFSEYLKTRRTELKFPMSVNERSFSIWRQEKLLSCAACRSVLRYNGWEGKLNAYATPEPFFDYLCGGGPIGTLLVLENKDTWYTLRRLLMNHLYRRNLFGVRLDGVVLGEGNKAARPHALEEYASFLPGPAPRFYYFGDLDYTGIQIYQSVVDANPGLEIRLFASAYRAMLIRSRQAGTEAVTTSQSKPAGLVAFLSLFDAEESEQIKRLLESGRFLPQEILTCPYLESQLMEAGNGNV